MNWKALLITTLIVQWSPVSYAQYSKDSGCFEKWLSGYKLAAGRPQRIFTLISLERCQTECERERGCGAFAYGVTGAANGTCELAVRTLRDSRSVSNTTLAYDEITKAHQYDIYMMSPGCNQRQPLFGAGSTALAPVGNGVPIDCFYRLMSGKRLAKNHVFRSISVAGLQECQEACIDDNHCRSISYRYMVSSTYTYNVANCELSPFYIVSSDDSNRRGSYDFVDDFDYDYFQREPHCKTTSRVGSFGVCAVVARRGAKLVPSLIKSTHYTSTATQCEFFCQTASRFRCRAFSLRHTTRGRDPFHRDTSYESVCTLYDVDVGRLPQNEIVSDPDYDLYELGRLMGAECVLQDQYLNRRPSPTGFTHTQHIPPPGYEDDRRRPIERYPYGNDRDYSQSSRERPSNYRPSTDHYPSRRPYDYDYHSKRPTGNYYPPPEQKVIDGSFPRPGLTEVSGSVTHGIGTSSFSRPTTPPNLPFYDPRREACLVKIKQDVYLAPEEFLQFVLPSDYRTRAQFPVKTLEECRIECLRSLEVFRFPCRIVSFRLTSNSGGSCQISEYYEQDLRPNDFITARDRYENAVVYSYDETDVLCRRDEGRYGGTRYGGTGGHSSTGSGYLPDSRDHRYGTSYPPDKRDHRYGTSHGISYGGSYGSSHGGSYGSSHGGSYGSNYGTGYGTSTVVEHYGRQPQVDYRPTGDHYDSHRRDSYGATFGSNYGKENYDHRQYLPPRTGSSNDVQSYTVNGEKCLRQCSQDRDAGFYYCVVDGRGTWDFCCRPDHYCGYSRGLSTPWCYVGSGPTSQVWRSCNHRLLSESPNPPIAYLHDRPPPKVHSLTTSEVANLSKDNALKLLKTSSSSTTPESDFSNLDGEDITTALVNSGGEMEKASSNVNGTEFYYGNKGNNETFKIISRQSRRISRKPTFTLVEDNNSVNDHVKKEELKSLVH